MTNPLTSSLTHHPLFLQTKPARCVAVFFTLQRTSVLTATSLYVLCAVSWLLPIATAFYPFFKSGHYYYSPVLGYYLAHLEINSHLEEQILLFSSNLIVLIPFFLTTGLCVAIAMRLQRGKTRRLRRKMWWSNSNKTRTTGVSMASSQRRNSPGDTGNSCQLKRLSRRRHPGCIQSTSELLSPPLKTKESHTHNSEQMQGDQPKSHKTKSTKSTKSRPSSNSSIVVLKIIGLYILCLLPGNLMNLYNMLATLDMLPDSLSLRHVFSEDSLLTMYLYMCLIFSTLLYTMNSCVNPYVYYFRSHKHCQVFLAKVLFNLRNVFG